MSAPDEQNHTSSTTLTRTTSTTNTWTASSELSSTSKSLSHAVGHSIFSTSAPMSSWSSSSTIASLSLTSPLLPSVSTPNPLPPPPSSASPSSVTSSALSMSASLNLGTTTTLPSTIIVTIPTTTTSITTTPTTIITMTTTSSAPATLSSSTRLPTTSISITSIPTTTIPTTITIVIAPTSSSMGAAFMSPSVPTASATSREIPGTSPSAATTPPTSPSTSTVAPTPEAQMTSPTPITAVSTYSTTVYISTTDFRGSTTVYAPPFITTTTTFLGPGGMPTTSTAIMANPTLNPDNSSPSSFFQNKGAVAGVFTLVGLAAISITVWVIVFIRRRRRALSLERDKAVSASLAAAGFIRTPLDDEDDLSGSSDRSRYDSREFLAIPMTNPDTGRHRRSILPDAYQDDRGQYDNLIQYAPRNSRDGYHEIPTIPPPPSAFGLYRDRTSSDGVGMVEVGNGLSMVYPRHSHQSSGGSLEPLLASHARRNGPLVPGQGAFVRDTVPSSLLNGRASRTPPTENGSSSNTLKPIYLQGQPNFYATNASSRSGLLVSGQTSKASLVDANGEIQQQDGAVPGDAEAASTAEDEPELQRPILAVRNLPDAASTLSLS